LCRGFFMVSCIVPSSPKRVSQETVQRTTTRSSTVAGRSNSIASLRSGWSTRLTR
jgi:hypothetical protein